MKTQVVFDKAEKIIKIQGVSGSLDERVTGRFGASVLYNFNGYNFHPRALHVLANVDELRFKSDDVLLTMFPKSGSTWLSECIYLVEHQYKYELAQKESIEYRFPQIDSPSHDVFRIILDQYDDVRCKRLIKASIPPNLLIDKKADTGSLVRPKVISILRNPRDVLVSFYHHSKTVKHYDLNYTFDRFFDTFVAGKVPCGPIWKMYNDVYAYHTANPKTSLLVFYEDMKKDLRKQIIRICVFLNKQPPATQSAWEQFIDHLSVEKMRQNQTINRHDWDKLGLKNANGFEFVRRGQANDWKNFFNEQQSLVFDDLVAKLEPELRKMYAE